jgi:hypothetical protein
MWDDARTGIACARATRKGVTACVKSSQVYRIHKQQTTVGRLLNES